MSEIVKARKSHKCNICNGIIRKGQFYHLEKSRSARYNEDDIQIGIEYCTLKTHISNCWPRLTEFTINQIRHVLKKCNYGRHEFEESYNSDGYSYSEPTGEFYCKWCGDNSLRVMKDNQ